MESSSSSFPSFEYSLSHWDYLDLYILRPILAILFTFSLISLGWFLAWKLVLVHVPLVQEIFGLRKKPAKSKPPTRRLSKFYDSLNSQTSASGWFCVYRCLSLEAILNELQNLKLGKESSSTGQLFVRTN
ncbi:uncharacterized protein LOC103488423 isoform X2 [Cucumis melo]|uniref:Uncharacterized protein LOC103488423 isoform X2 n=2 Tax=Cucumis melo TaxID=3656 RepID=A0A1S3BCI8_CUCME|nr:uncharacterized protein LOC103488423 isoform X2 [Cucumis melo]